MEEKTSIKRSREDRAISDDASAIIGSFLPHTNITEMKAMKISSNKLIEEIHKYKPLFTLEDYLMTLRKKKESLGYILYSLIKDLKWNIEVINDSYTTIGVIPKIISQLVVRIEISNISVVNATKIITYFNIVKERSSKYPISVWYKESTSYMLIKLDIEDYSIPNELIYLREKDNISRLLISETKLQTFDYNKELFVPKPKRIRLYY